MNQESRQHPRFAIDLDCVIMALGATLFARTRNLSRSGISCMVPEPLSTGTEVVLQIALNFEEGEHSEAIRLAATIMWCTPLGEGWQIGARFGELPPQHKRVLAVFIQFLEGIDED